MIRNEQNFTTSHSQSLNQILNERPKRISNDEFKPAYGSINSASSQNLATSSDKPNHEASFIVSDIIVASKRMNRKSLIETALSLANSCITIAHQGIMDTINIRLKKLKNKEYIGITKKLSEMATKEAEQVHDFLCSYIDAYRILYNKYNPRYGL